MKSTLIGNVAVTLLALVVAEGCKVTTTSDHPDSGGPSGETGGSAGSDKDGGESGGKGGAGGSSGAAGSHAGGAANTGGTHDGGPDANTADSGAPGGTTGGGGDSGGAGTGTDAGKGDPCGSDEARPNDDRDHATAYALGTDFHGCLQTKDDVDFYSFAAPATPAQGGYFIVSETEVGTGGSVRLTVQAVADNGDVVDSYGGRGESVFVWYDAKAGASFHVKADYFTSDGTPTPYTLKVTYKGVNDVNEPNDTRATATAMTAGTPIHGYEFAGFENSAPPVTAAWEDWFKVTLPAGMATVTLADLASDVNGDVTLYDSLGVMLKRNYESDRGATVVVTQTITAGDYYVKVSPFTGPDVKGQTSTVPAYLSQPYTLTASVE